MGASRTVRAALAILTLAGALVVTATAMAHTCSPSADQPVDLGSTIKAHGEVDCNDSEPDDILHVKLWRVREYAFDDFWGQTDDPAPPVHSGFVYHAVVNTCQAGDPPDNFKTETRTTSIHSVSANAYSSGSNLNC